MPTLPREKGNIGTKQVDESAIADDVIPVYNSTSGKYELEAKPVAAAKPDFIVDIGAGEWDYPTANPAPPDTDTGTNGVIKRQLFDSTTEEFVIKSFKLPSDIDPAGTVTFQSMGYAVTAAASRNIAMTVYHSARAAGESWDAAYSTKASGDLACNENQDRFDGFQWTATVAALGWSANDVLRMKVSRTAPSGNNLVGDYGLHHFRVKVPRV